MKHGALGLDGKVLLCKSIEKKHSCALFSVVLLSAAIDHGLRVVKYSSVDIGHARGWWGKGLDNLVMWQAGNGSLFSQRAF